jgi:chaperonin GroES
MKLRPLHDRILVKRVDPEAEVKGGIIIPDTAKEKPQEGVVVAVGNGKIRDNGTRVEMTVKEGDRILFGKYSGNEVKLDGEEYLIMREEDVLAVTEGAAKTKSSGK